MGEYDLKNNVYDLDIIFLHTYMGLLIEDIQSYYFTRSYFQTWFTSSTKRCTHRSSCRICRILWIHYHIKNRNANGTNEVSIVAGKVLDPRGIGKLTNAFNRVHVTDMFPN